jgi:hypothetical protein
MNTANHTPGPWAIETVKRTIGDSKETYDSLCVTFASPLRAKLICELGADTLPDNPQNAHLIASAPDLLSALRFLLADYIAIQGDELTGSSVPLEMARAALAKARGEA